MPEEEGDNMAETHDESENGVVEEFRVQGPELDEAGSSTPSTLRPSSLTVLLGQTFNAVTTVEPKSVQTKVEEEVRKYLEAPSLPLTDNPLVVALQRSCVPSPSQTCQTTRALLQKECSPLRGTLCQHNGVCSFHNMWTSWSSSIRIWLFQSNECCSVSFDHSQVTQCVLFYYCVQFS